jgi:hypothetical protein
MPQVRRIVGPLHMRAEHLKHVGWAPYQVVSYARRRSLPLETEALRSCPFWGRRANPLSDSRSTGAGEPDISVVPAAIQRTVGARVQTPPNRRERSAWGQETTTAPLPSHARGVAYCLSRAGLPSRGTALRLLARHPARLLARPFCRRPPHFGRPGAESLRARAAEVQKERLDGSAAIVHILRAPLHPVALDALLIWHLCADPLPRFKHGRI